MYRTITRAIFLFALLLFISLLSSAQVVTTITDFNIPQLGNTSSRGICQDSKGNIYVSNRQNQIMKIEPNGAVSLFAGSPSGAGGYANGPDSLAKFNQPWGLCTDKNDNIYVADHSNHRIRKITPSGYVSNYAGSGVAGYKDGGRTVAQFQQCRGICADDSGNIFVPGFVSQRLRKIDLSGNVTTIAGSTYGVVDGTGSNAKFHNPSAITVDNNDNLLVADGYGRALRLVTKAGKVTTINRKLHYYTSSIDVDTSGNIYLQQGHGYAVADYNGNIRTILQPGKMKDGPIAHARSASWGSLVVDNLQGIYFTDGGRLRRISSTALKIDSLNINRCDSFLWENTNTPFYHSANRYVNFVDSNNVLTDSLIYLQISIAGVSSEGIVANYPFNQSTIDLSGNLNSGYGYKLTYGSDRFFRRESSACFKSGDSSFFRANLTYEPSFNQNATISGWVKQDSTSTLSNQTIFALGRPRKGRAIILCTSDTSGLLTFGTHGELLKTQHKVDSNWHFYSLTCSPGRIFLYIDGELIDSVQHSIQIDTVDLVIGKNLSSPTEFWNGKIDDVSLWNRTLSNAEIQLAYRGGLPRLKIDSVTSCDSFTWTNGITYYSDNFTAQDTFATPGGCDSIVRLNLRLAAKTKDTLQVFGCDFYRSALNKIWRKSGIYSDTFTNISGCDSIVFYDLFIGDTAKPSVRTRNVEVSLDASGNTSITASAIDNGSSDNCSIRSMTLSQSAFDCSEVGANTLWLIVTDVNGNADSATAVVTVIDTIRPTVVTQDITLYLDASGNASTTATAIDNGSSDNCSISSRTLSQSAFDCSEVGPNTIWLYLTDANGNIDSASAVVTVRDTTKPIVRTADVTLYLDTLGKARVATGSINKGSSDNCAIDTMSLSQYDFDCSDVGANTIYLRITDVNGNTDSATAVVTIKDQITPTVITQDVTLYLDAGGNASATASAIDNGSSDNCSIGSMTLSQSAFDCSEIGANTVWLIVTDVNGNADSTSAVVTVKDQITPTVITQNVTLYLDASGNAILGASQVDNGSSDNCSISSRTLSQSSFDCSNAGTNTIWLIVTDVNGNTDSASAVVSVVDTIRPIVRTQNRTVYLNSIGLATMTADSINNGSSDNCAINNTTLSQYQFTCNEVGPNTIQLIALDDNGNTDSTSAVVTVIDTIRPTVVTQDITLYLDGSGNASTTATAIDNGSSDNCSISSRTLSQSAFDCSEVGANTIWLYLTDANGNIDSASAVVTVRDTTKPIVRTADVTLYLDTLGKARVATGSINKGSSDNCAIDTMSLSQYDFDCSDMGANTIYLRITDVNGNTDSAAAVVTIKDQITPTVITQDVMLYLDAGGNASTTVSAIDNGSSDNCSIGSMTLSQSAFDCSEVGANTVWLIATDVNGNTDSATAVVTVKDTTTPTFLDVPSDMAFGYCDAVVNYIAPTGDDNCSFTITQIAGLASGETFPVGLTVNKFLIEDPSGNKDSISFTVAISGKYLPFALEDTTLCKNHKWLDLSKETSSILFDGTGVMSDGITYNPLDGDLGFNTVNATFIDSMGCTTTGNLAILLLDVPLAPEIERIASSKIQVKNGPFNSYQWYLDGNLIPQETNQELRALQLGEYMVEVGNAQGCFAASEIYTFGFDYESADILAEGNIKVSPNPNNGIFFVQFDDDQEIHQLELTNNTGVVVLTKETRNKVQRLDINYLTSGTYLLRVSSATSNATFQIIKK